MSDISDFASSIFDTSISISALWVSSDSWTLKWNKQKLDDHEIVVKFFKDFDQNSGDQP